MKWYGVSASLAVLAAMLYAGPVSSRQSQPAIPTTRPAVLVELFTSEGCSSCPPADQVLAQLDSQQPVAGVEIIAMSEHVDYWNSLGWKDPFSASVFTDRQNSYASAFGNSNVYTPQMVIDGQAEFIGNDVSQAVEAVASTARVPKAPLGIRIVSADTTSAKVRVQMPPLPDIIRKESADIYLAVIENNLSSNVIRGENKGHQLSHVAVVRSLAVIGRIAPGKAYSAESTVPISANWKRSDLQLVAFAQTHKKRHIIALSKISL